MKLFRRPQVSSDEADCQNKSKAETTVDSQMK